MSVTAKMPSGSGAAAVLAAGVGSFVLAALSFAADKSPAAKTALNWYKPTGALSGETTAAIMTWLLVWAVLEFRWRRKEIAIGPIATAALALLAMSLLLTFPPVADWL